MDDPLDNRSSEADASKKRPLDSDTAETPAAKRVKTEETPELPSAPLSTATDDSAMQVETTSTVASTATNEAQPGKGPKYKKTKLALLLAYDGANYFGSQRNGTTPTIELAVEAALCQVGAISADNAHDFTKTSFGSCSRTDKGVSALGNISAAKLLQIPDLQNKLNKALPEEIRVLAIQRVTNGFSPKNLCDARTYDYFIPTYVFKPDATKFPEEAKDWKFAAETRQQINALLSQFVGTHKFHHYSSKVPFTDVAASRYLISYECSETFLVDGIEFVSLRVNGQSFILHQIRKMTSMCVRCMRNKQPKEVIRGTFYEPKFGGIPKAPGEGLVLRECSYKVYNKRVKPPNEPLNWGQEVSAAQDLFATTKFLPKLVKAEKQDNIFGAFVQDLDAMPYDFTAAIAYDPKAGSSTATKPTTSTAVSDPAVPAPQQSPETTTPSDSAT